MEIRYPRTRFRRRSAVRRDIDRLLSAIREAAEMGLHLGAGSSKIPGLINCDWYVESADRKINCTDLSEFEDGSVDLIEAHHVLEHLSFDQTHRALAEWFRALKQGARLVITCPDVTAVARRWLRLSLQHRLHACPHKRDYVLKMIYGSQEHEGMFHRSGYDRTLLSELLVEHGFAVEFSYAPYPARATPSLLMIARRSGTAQWH